MGEEKQVQDLPVEVDVRKQLLEELNKVLCECCKDWYVPPEDYNEPVCPGCLDGILAEQAAAEANYQQGEAEAEWEAENARDEEEAYRHYDDYPHDEEEGE